MWWSWLVMFLVSCRSGEAARTGSPEVTDDTAGDSGDSGDTGTEPGDPYYGALLVGVIGDYGLAGENEAAVSELVAGWNPALVLTTGDNNYFDGSDELIDENIGQYYHGFISPYVGTYGEGADINRFFPTLGNHDWMTTDAVPYLGYFELPGNERYYDFTWGDAHFFAVDSDPHEPDGVTSDSLQGAWLRDALAASTAPWNIVYFHHAPYSSGTHESSSSMQWPFEEWGADLVLAGHDHDYERVVTDGLPYVVVGTGGGDLRPFGPDQVDGSQAGLDLVFGALLLEITSTRLRGSFQTVDGVLFDRFDLLAGERFDGERTWVSGGADWRYLDDGVGPPDGWTEPEFADSAWAQGAAPLGYGEDDIVTEVSYGSASSDKHVTTWFRREFELDGPDGASALRVSLRRDDGALVYLNGHLVMRSNMPDGTVTADTLATAAISGDDEKTWSEATVSPNLLEDGVNVVAVEVHQADVTSSDLALDVELTGTVGRALLETGGTWSYLDTGSAPAQGWETADFDPSGWSTGPSPLGYGQGDEATTVDYGDATNKHVTTWFRGEFEVEDPGGYSSLLLRLVRDDGAIVYLNGHEVVRHNLPAGAVTENTPAYYEMVGWWETLASETLLPADMLVAGTNVVAAEVHQATPDSSDLRFDLEVIGR